MSSRNRRCIKSRELHIVKRMNPELTQNDERIPISREEYLKKLNDALGEDNISKGLKFFEAPNHLHPGEIDWVRGSEVDPIYIRALEQVEAAYRPMAEDIVPDNVGRAYGVPGK